MIQTKDQKLCIGQTAFCEEVRKWIEQAIPICPEVQKAMRDQFSRDQLINELLPKMKQQNIWLDSKMLIFWMKNANQVVENCGDESVWVRVLASDKKVNISPCTAFLLDYRSRHSEEPWSRSFMDATVYQDNFIELFFYLDLKFSKDALRHLIKRQDILQILNTCKITFPEDIQMEFADDLELVLAYAKNSGCLSSQVFAKIHAPLADVVLAELLESINHELPVTVGETRYALLARKCYRITKKLLQCGISDVSETEMQLILDTPKAPELVGIYLTKCYMVPAELKAKVLKILDQNNKSYYNWVSVMLRTQVCLDFVTEFSDLPDDCLEKMIWEDREIMENVEFWILTLQTRKAKKIMAFYKQAIKQKNATPNEQVLMALVEQPNAPEMVAMWVYNYRLFTPAFCNAIKKSEYYEAIIDVLPYDLVDEINKER